MRLKTYLGLTLAFLFVCAAYPALAQTAPAATEAKPPFAIGAGFSDFDTDWNNGRMYGGMLWIDYIPNRIPQRLHGLGLEVEGSDVSITSKAAQKDFRVDVASGGVIYSYRHYRRIRPYGKFLMGYGNSEYPVGVFMSGKGRVLKRYSQSRTVTSAGGGVEVPAFRNLWLRADYEYQFWPDFFYNRSHVATGEINPNGVTVGVLYHFGLHHSQ